jgi:hypothetical protein
MGLQRCQKRPLQLGVVPDIIDIAALVRFVRDGSFM